MLRSIVPVAAATTCGSHATAGCTTFRPGDRSIVTVLGAAGSPSTGRAAAGYRVRAPIRTPVARRPR
ncbi:hypothetical protein, partial [Nocardia niwae]